MTQRRSGGAPVVLLLALLLVVSACSGSGKPSASKGSPSSSSSSSSSSASGSDAPAPDPGAGVARVGQCSKMTAAQVRASVAEAPVGGCRAPHTTVVVYVGYATKAVTPLTPVRARQRLGTRLCEPAYRAFVGGTLADRATSLLTWTLFTPGEADLRAGARWIRCDVFARSGNRLVPLPDIKPLLKAGIPEQLRICEDARGVDLSCASPHRSRLEAVFRASLPRYPGVSSVVARNRCRQLLKAYGGYVQLPSRAGWAAGDRFIRCLGPTLPAPTATPTP